MQRRDHNDRDIHAVAFVAHQFYRCQDNMIDLWLSVMASFKSTAAREYQETLVQCRKDQQRQIASVVDSLDVSMGHENGQATTRHYGKLTDDEQIRVMEDIGVNSPSNLLKLDDATSGTTDSWPFSRCLGTVVGGPIGGNGINRPALIKPRHC